MQLKQESNANSPLLEYYFDFIPGLLLKAICTPTTLVHLDIVDQASVIPQKTSTTTVPLWLALLKRWLIWWQEPSGQVEPPLPKLEQGTAFEQKVWQALKNIPYGQTKTYREIADSIGQPTASRAVAGACARNPFPILIPCHRVVASNGGLGGYSGHGGLATKKRLLAWEQKFAQTHH